MALLSFLRHLFFVAIIIDFPNNIYFATSLAPHVPSQQKEFSGGVANGRREALSSLFSTGIIAVTTTTLSLPSVTHAAIDVSGLKQAEGTKAINTDVFLGGTYVDDNKNKYFIQTEGTGFAGYRLVKVKGGSSKDDFVELPGMIFTCPGGGGGSRQCITVDFSSAGGPRDAQGYWDEAENGIRFVLENNVWPKQ